MTPPKDYTLDYEGKESEKHIIAETSSALVQKLRAFDSHRKLQFDTTWSNMLIFGDNLPVLKLLLNDPNVKSQVRLIYIDPPFSTNHEFRGGDGRTSTISYSKKDRHAYEDLLVGADYLEFLRKRLVLLRELLAEDGSIYVHIDWKKGHYVKVLMDEIFGESHFINDIARIKCNPKNFARRAYGNIKDMILFYSKSNSYYWHESLEDYADEDVIRLFPKIDKEGRRYTTNPLHAPGETINGPTGRPWRGISPPECRHWRCSPTVLDDLDGRGLIEWSSTNNPRKKIYAEDYIRKKKKRQDIWEFKDPPYPKYPTEKNIEMIKVIIDASSKPNDLVLDCFSGSGNTLVAAENMDRRWIGIDNSLLATEVTLKTLLALKAYSAFSLYKSKEALLSDAIQEILQQ